MLIGNLTRDPEIKYTGTGIAVCSFSVATDRSWKDQSGELQQVPEYHNLVAWDKLAEICNSLLKKGMLVYIEGSLTTRSWEDKEGKTNYKTEIRVSEMKLLNDRGRGGAGQFEASSTTDSSDDSGSVGKTPEELLEEIENQEMEADSSKKKKNDKSSEEGNLDDLPF